MKQVVATSGGVAVQEVPAPGVEPGTVVVRVAYSCISVGTELSGVRHAETPLWRRAMANPAKVKRAIDVARKEGFGELERKLRSRTAVGSALGYSAAGRVVEVGDGVDDLAVGDLVACAGAGVANHAEMIRVPRNLAVPVPEGLDLRFAATVTLGAIALQGIRRANPTLGETFVVIGLGAIGQLTAQLLRLAGCRVVVSDLDPSRVDLALRLGADVPLASGDDVEQRIRRLTDGVGADGVIITASTPSDDVVASAFGMCRKKARVVLVGDVGLHLQREHIYAKELDFLVSTSYGPGRYDRRYEEDGLEYPIGYVRWTENRNMSEVLRLLAGGRLDVSSLIGDLVPLSQAPRAYELLAGPERPTLVLLDATSGEPATGAVTTATPRVRSRSGGASKAEVVRVALIGPGSFASAVHVPNLRSIEGAALHAVVGRTGLTATALANQFDAAYATTEVDDVLGDDEVDAVLIATRHDQHSSLTLRALEAGKHVFVEKPLAIGRAGHDAVRAWFEGRDDAPLLLVGHNRRFSPLITRLAEELSHRAAPIIVDYRMNAGHLPPDHWVHGPEGGGRNLGEACHIYDLFTTLTGSTPVDVSAHAAASRTAHYRRDDNFVATIAFGDGSVATLTYTALGSTAFAKEQMTIFSDGSVYVLDDYAELTATGERAFATGRRPTDKGHRAQLQAFIEGIREGRWPVPLAEQLIATDVALEVQRLLQRPSGGA